MNPGRPGSQPRSLKARAMLWLAQREHSRSELRRKLLRYAQQGEAGEGADDDPERAAPARVDALLDWLEAHRYLSQERFAESRVHARAARYGNLRIRQELALHQVTLSPSAEQGLNETELARAHAVWRRRFGAAATGPAERAKQARFLTSRGFSAEVVRRVLREGGTTPAGGETDDPPH